MSRITYFPRYSTYENVVTNTTLHLFSQINQQSPERLRELLSGLFGGQEIPLGVSIHQQVKSVSSVPDGIILQEPLHIAIETKVEARVDIGQLIRHCEGFNPGRPGNYLLLLTREVLTEDTFHEVFQKAKEIGVTFKHLTFESLCESLKGCVREYETHLNHVVCDYIEYCSEMALLPDRRSWLRIVPCGDTFDLNVQWQVYYQPTDRGYSPHEYIGIYNQKAVRYIGKVAAVYDNMASDGDSLNAVCVEGVERPEFRDRITQMVRDTKEQVGWDISSGTRFFCVDKFAPTEFRKTSAGGIQGARFWDVTGFTSQTSTIEELAELLRQNQWE